MLTPRRFLLVLTISAVLTSVFLLYFRFLGAIDGLPELPKDYLPNAQAAASPIPANPGVSRTKEQLRRAFGPNSPEATDNGQLYKLQTQLTDKGIVLACGQPQISPASEPSRKVVVAPFSMAQFGKPKPPSLTMNFDEIEEISTISADKAILEFDQPIVSPQDMFTKAKLLGFELVSTPDLPSTDARSGKVWVTNNQRSRDPNQFLVFSTVGPVYYNTPDREKVEASHVPHIWTSAEVEVVDRRNLPRALRSNSVLTSGLRGDELRKPGTVESILLGDVYPPPTITAEGMNIFLIEEQKQTNERTEGNKAGKPSTGTGYTGVRLVELLRKVQFNQWIDGSTGFPTASSGTTTRAEPSLQERAEDPSPAMGSLGGGLVDAVAVAKKLTQALLVIETSGVFRYDFTSNQARFESDEAGDATQADHVAVSRISADNKVDNLFCNLLIVDLDDGNARPAEPGQANNAPNNARSNSQNPRDGLKIRKLTATGPHVFISVEREQLLAQGTELIYLVQPAATQTTLRGNPVVAVLDRNKLKTGSSTSLGEIVIVTTEPPPANKQGNKEPKRNTLAVRGAGTIDLLDGATGTNTVRAVWGESLIHERTRFGTLEQDLLKFEGAAEFIDLKANMKLSANRIWLWLAQPEDTTPTAYGETAKKKQPIPQRLEASGSVRTLSDDLHIEKTDVLKLWFRDVPPPANASTYASNERSPTPPANDTSATTEPNTAEPKLATANQETAPAKKNPPIVLSAATIESWLIRYPQELLLERKTSATMPIETKPSESNGLKYELERAICTERVVVHQDPTDPEKNPRGLDIAGYQLNLDAVRVNDQIGQKMVVVGEPGKTAEVKFESVILIGPKIEIDQINNTVAVAGAGRLLMPSGSDLSGNPVAKPNVLDIRWLESMFFNGAKGNAEFLGQVYAMQRPDREQLLPPKPNLNTNPKVTTTKANGINPERETWSQSRLVCHRLDCTFDKPIYFNQFRRNDEKPGQPREEQAKLQTALALPMADDELAKAAEPIRLVRYTEETYTEAKQLLRAQQIQAADLSVRLREKMQEMFASGPGEVRLLQVDNSEWGTPAGAKAPNGPNGNWKLTHVKFISRMTAIEKNKLYQEATFENGANVWQIPTNNINLQYVAHALPVGTTTLSCVDMMKVSSSRIKPDAPAEQWLVAKGNAEFANDDYEGQGGTITADGKTITLRGTADRMANIYRRKQSLNDRQGTRAKTIVYQKDGTITATEGGSGVFIP